MTCWNWLMNTLRQINLVDCEGFDPAEIRGVRDQICTTEGPKVNHVRQVDFWCNNCSLEDNRHTVEYDPLRTSAWYCAFPTSEATSYAPWEFSLYPYSLQVTLVSSSYTNKLDDIWLWVGVPGVSSALEVALPERSHECVARSLFLAPRWQNFQQPRTNWTHILMSKTRNNKFTDQRTSKSLRLEMLRRRKPSALNVATESNIIVRVLRV